MKELSSFIVEAMSEIKLKQVPYLPSGIMTGKYESYTILTIQCPDADVYSILYFTVRNETEFEIFFSNTLNCIGDYIKYKNKSPRMVKGSDIGPDGELRVFYTKVEPTMPKKLQKALAVPESAQKALKSWMTSEGYNTPISIVKAFIKKDKKWTLDEINDKLPEFSAPLEQLKKLDISKPLVLKYNEKYIAVSDRLLTEPDEKKYNFFLVVTCAHGSKPERYMSDTPADAIDKIGGSVLSDIIDCMNHTYSFGADNMVFIASSKEFIYNSVEPFKIFIPKSFDIIDGYNIIEVELSTEKFKLKPLESSQSIN